MTGCSSSLWLTGVILSNVAATLFCTVFLLRWSVYDVLKEDVVKETIQMKKQILEKGLPAQRRSTTRVLDF